MKKIACCLVMFTSAFTSLSGFAQETINRSDLFGQPVTPLPGSTTNPVPAQTPEQRRVNISNMSTQDADPRGAAYPAGETGAYDASGRQQQGQQGQQGPQQLPQTQMQQANGRLGRQEPLPSEFQKFIFESSGKRLPVYGADFFVNAASTFNPSAGGPVPSDYPLGVGDELLIRGTGSIDIDYRATIDRNGLISIPTIGPISLAGVKSGDAESVIRAAVARLYKGVNVNVTFGKLRAITVYVVGQARRPGTYTVSSLSTLVTTLFASGGPNNNGSLRHLQVKRGGKLVAELDLYAFIAKGDKSADIKLQDGDTVYIPAAAGYVALTGKVNMPAIYELRGVTDTVESALDIAGGLPVVADPRRAYLERVDSSKSQPRTVEQFALNADGLKRTLKNGDVLNVTSITPDFSNAVVLRGNVDQPIRAPFLPNMRVSDLIPSREYLISRNSINRQNNILTTSESLKGDDDSSDNIASRIGGLIDEINWEYAVVERINRKDLTVSLIPFNLSNVFANPDSPDNVRLQAGDTVTIFSQKDVAVPMAKRRIFVRVEGEVRVPGVYQMNAGDTLQSLLVKAGGATSDAYLFGSAFFREQVRVEQQLNLEKAANKLQNQLRNEQARGIANSLASTALDAQAAEIQRQAEMKLAQQAIERFRQIKPTGRIAFGLNPTERSFAALPALKLENGDRFLVPARPDFVNVIGAVNAESSLLWIPNGRVSDYLKKSGTTVDADVDNTFIMRVDGSVSDRGASGWGFGGVGGIMVMPGDSIIVPEKFDKETKWSKFIKGTREWAQIFANFGLGAAAIKTLRN